MPLLLTLLGVALFTPITMKKFRQQDLFTRTRLLLIFDSKIMGPKVTKY
jgi:hypothetical protein